MAFPFPIVIKDKSILWCSVRSSIIIIIVALIYTGVTLQLQKFAVLLIYAAAVILPNITLHVGETLSKVLISMLANIIGAVVGHGLSKFSDSEIRKAKFLYLLPIIFILLVMGILPCLIVKVVKDKYDYGPKAFLLAMLVGAFDPMSPDWLAKELKNAALLGLSCGLTILSAFLPPFFAGDDVHYRVQENIDTLASIFKVLDEKCFGELLQNLQDKLFRQDLLSIIDSKQKENSLSKFVSWEPRKHPQEQYEKIGDLIRLCASNILSLSITVENMQFSTDLRETCKEICSESAKALTLLSLSMKDKTAPEPSINNHLTAAQDLALRLEDIRITSHFITSVKIIEKLVTSIKELPSLVPSKVSKQSEQDNNLPELLTRLGLPLWFIPAIQEVATRTNKLIVAPMKNMVSRLIAFLKKLKTKFSSVSDGPDTTKPHVNLVPIGTSETQKEEVAHVAIDINPSAGPV